MDLFDLKWEKENLVITFHWLFLLMCLLVVVIITFVIIRRKVKRKSAMEVESYEVTVGSFKTTIVYDFSDRETAYKAWVEMDTRKVGLVIDEKNDVIVEVYNSWYAFFGILRNIMKEIPGRKLDCSHELIDLLSNVLNGKLREHLTCWQAKFRKWYDEAFDDENNKGKTPQEIQMLYPEFDLLVNDMKEVNNQLCELKNALYMIAFNDIKEKHMKK